MSGLHTPVYCSYLASMGSFVSGGVEANVMEIDLFESRSEQ